MGNRWFGQFVFFCAAQFRAPWEHPRNVALTSYLSRDLDLAFDYSTHCMFLGQVKVTCCSFYLCWSQFPWLAADQTHQYMVIHGLQLCMFNLCNLQFFPLQKKDTCLWPSWSSLGQAQGGCGKPLPWNCGSQSMCLEDGIYMVHWQWHVPGTFW
jgi:hypothetical protein